MLVRVRRRADGNGSRLGEGLAVPVYKMSHTALHRSIGPRLILARINPGLVALAQFPILFGRQPPELGYTAHFVISPLDGVLSYQPYSERFRLSRRFLLG